MLVNKNLANGMVSKMLDFISLMHILFLASVFNKLADGKPPLQASWAPAFRPIFGYYNQQSYNPFYRPFNPLFFSSRFPPAITTNLPQLQAPPFIHQHKNIFGLGNINKFFPLINTKINTTNIDISNVTDTSVNTTAIITNIQEIINSTLPAVENFDIIVKDLHSSSAEKKSKNLTREDTSTENDLFVTPNPPDDENDVFGDLIKYFKKQIKQNKTLLESIEIQSNDEDARKKSCGENCEVTSFSPEDQVFAESNQELEVAEANIFRKKQRLPTFADEFYDYLSRQRKPDQTRYTNNVRLNSKRGQYRTTTSPYYEDYDFTTPRNRRKTTPRRSYYRRRTTPSYEIDEYEDNRPNRRKGSFDNRRATTPAYDEYYEDEYDYTNNRPQIRPRQEDTTDAESSSTTTTTESTTTTTAGSSTTSTTSPTTTTTSSYPYPGNNANNNVSITYGPPFNHAGYGPSNGNEHVSITYGPPTGPNFGPLLDSWYNQYTKSSVLKRIQELLTPNNYYSPQYEMDKYNNYDSVF